MIEIDYFHIRLFKSILVITSQRLMINENIQKKNNACLNNFLCVVVYIYFYLFYKQIY